MSRFGKFVALAAVAVGLLAPAAAQAELADLYGGDVSCETLTGSGDLRLCGGPTTSWDGTKVDVDVILPPEPSSGADGPYPTIGNFHGWGGAKIGVNSQTQGWAEDGYAVFSMSDRGWGDSCGGADLERLLPACAAGYNHLMDSRYEVRDAQYLLSVLADEGVVQPRRIGATGVSYGGGISMALAALGDRTMLPDGSLIPWRSPAGTPMALAAAVPQWPWTDLAYSLMPNGRSLDYVADAPYYGPNGDAPVGIEKSSYVGGLYGTGQLLSNYALPGTDPGADLVTWFALINAGEPYAANPLVPQILAEITAHHSSYYIDHGQPPAPLLIQSGWNDDLFPADEALRFYNRTRTQYPGDPISLYFSDDGHARSQNKAADEAAFRLRQDAWFDHYLKDQGPAPGSSVEALTTTCDSPSAGPYRAATWSAIAPGEIRLGGTPAQTIVPGAGDPGAGTSFDPIAGGGACASASGADPGGTASYRLPPTPGGGFTLLGSPTVVADLDSPGQDSALSARLLDVAPAGTETLVARGLLRPAGLGAGAVFQLHPQGYRFEPGHVAKLELLSAEAPYSRPSNLQQPITVSNLELRLPVLEAPGALGGLVQAPAPKVLPPGYELARDYPPRGGAGGVPVTPPATAPQRGRIRVLGGRVVARRKVLLARLRCAGAGPCAGTLRARLRGAGRKRAKRDLARGRYALAPGQARRVRVRLTRAGRGISAALRRHHRRPARPLRLRARLLLAGADGAGARATRPLRLERG